jgi:hypothetical protein
MRLVWKRRSLKDRPPGSAPGRSACCVRSAEPGRECLTPIVAVGRRRISLPSISSCCVSDPLQRAAWWEQVEGVCRFDLDRAVARFVVVELRQMIPYPDMPELAAYEAHKRQQERNLDAQIAPLKAAFLGAFRDRGK